MPVMTLSSPTPTSPLTVSPAGMDHIILIDWIDFESAVTPVRSPPSVCTHSLQFHLGLPPVIGFPPMASSSTKALLESLNLSGNATTGCGLERRSRGPKSMKILASLLLYRTAVL